MSSENFLYQVEGIGALPDASLYTDRYWAVPTGDSTYQCVTYKSDGANWVFVDGVIPYGPGLSYETVESLPENCVFIDPAGTIWQKQGSELYILSADFGESIFLISSDGFFINDNLYLEVA